PEEPGRAQRTHRIPHADHADRRTLALRLDVVKTAPPLLGVGLDVVFVARKHIRHVVVVALVEQADEVHESGQGARGECTAGKSEQVDLVAFLVVVDEEAIDVAHVVLDAAAECAAGHLVHSAAGTDAFVVVDDLVDTVACARQDGTSEFGHIGRTPLAGRLVELIANVPCAIGTDDDPFHAFLPTRSSAVLASKPQRREAPGVHRPTPAQEYTFYTQKSNGIPSPR